MWDWLTDGYHTRIVESGRQPLFLLLVGLLGSFLFIRFSVRMIRRGTSWWPGNVQPGGLHIHHVVFGQAMMLIGGVGAFALRGEESVGRDLLALLFGVGAGLVLDEFALVLHLKDVYWSEEGRQSVDAVILAVAVIGLLLLGITPLGDLSGGSVLTRVIAGTVLMALVVVSLLKGKVWTGFFGLFLVFLPLFGAVRLARPNSPWARWRYYARPRRLARAERREAAIRGRLRVTRRAVYNAVAGAPHPSSAPPRGVPGRTPREVTPRAAAGGADPAGQRARPGGATGRRRPSTADLGPSRTERALRRLREPCAVAVVWYLRLAALADLVTGVVAPFRARLRDGGTGEVITPFLVTAGFTSAAVAALLAVTLRRRKRAAWLLAFSLALVNTAAYWLTLVTAPAYRAGWFNWASAAVTTLVAAALWVAGPVCRVRGEHGNVPLGMAWLVFGGAVAVGLGTLVVRSADSVPAAAWADCLRYALLRVLTLSTLVGLPDIAVPGWVDLLINVLSVLLLLQVLRAFFRSPRARGRLGPDDEHQLRVLLAEFGRQDSLGYFGLRRDASVAWAPGRDAAVLYRVVNGVALAAGDPVGDPASWPRAVSAWLRTARAHAWVPAVTCAGPHAAGVYGRLGLKVLAFGDEAVVRTAAFRLDDPAAAPVREAREALRAAGYRAVVRRQGAVPRAEADALARLADAWRRGAADRSGPAVSLARLGDASDPECVLVECRDPNDRTCALLSLVPWDGSGLALDLVRRDRESPEGLYGFLLAELLLRARADAAPVGGVDRIALGVAVRHAAPDADGRPGTGWVFRLHRLLARLPAGRHGAAVVRRTTAAFAPGWQPRFLLYERTLELPRIALANAGVGGLAAGGAPRVARAPAE